MELFHSTQLKALQHRRSRELATGNGRVGDDAPPLLRVKEESLVLDNRATDSEAEIVPAQGGRTIPLRLLKKLLAFRIVFRKYS